ncbi:PH domain-containing protein [Paenibacillus mendelii]|uniref:PH domain-containing protein n=1 Tax=Paenibacillus mendelii TaxID=206163 RepID=A0ABV6J8M7_9BACL|nr:PH domain-containing protein [Paenibacillus mendelii]MCQ6559571.1 PH domain-containing protein [Paenibacillus mendelii]
MENERLTRRIDEKALRAWRLSGWISTGVYAVITVALLVVTLKFDWPIWIPVLVFILACIGAYLEVNLMPRLRYKQWRYAITEHEIELQHGIYFRKRTLIPMIRVQHVDSKQGPILRAFGLATVTFSTAAGSHEIPALTEGRADEVRRQIAQLARLSDEEI